MGIRAKIYDVESTQWLEINMDELYSDEVCITIESINSVIGCVEISLKDLKLIVDKLCLK